MDRYKNAEELEMEYGPDYDIVLMEKGGPVRTIMMGIGSVPILLAIIGIPVVGVYKGCSSIIKHMGTDTRKDVAALISPCCDESRSVCNSPDSCNVFYVPEESQSVLSESSPVLDELQSIENSD